MPFSLFTTANRLATVRFFFHVFFFWLLILSSGAQARTAKGERVTKIGAIFDVNSLIRKEQKVAMEIAAHKFNKSSTNHKVALYFHDSGRDPYTATSSGWLTCTSIVHVNIFILCRVTCSTRIVLLIENC